MKVALLLFGQPRYIEDNQSMSSYEKHIISKYDTDVFGHMWFEEGIKYQISSWTYNAGLSDCTSVGRSDEIFRQRMNPKSLLVESPIDFNLKDQIGSIRARFGDVQVGDVRNIYSQLNSIQKVIRLFSEFSRDSEYDFIVLSRYDLIINNFPDLKNLDTNLLHLSNHHDFADLIMVFGRRFIVWLENLYDDSLTGETIDMLDKHYYPEGFKETTFLKYFDRQYINYINMSSNTIRK